MGYPEGGEERAALLGEQQQQYEYEPPSSPDSLGGGASFVSSTRTPEPRSRSHAGIQDSARPSPTESEAHAEEPLSQQPGSLPGLTSSRRVQDGVAGEIVPEGTDAAKPVHVTGYDGHGAGGDPSHCPFASLIAEAEAEIAARTAPTPYDDAAVAAEYAKVHGDGFAMGKAAPAGKGGTGTGGDGKHAHASHGDLNGKEAGNKQHAVRYGSFQAGSVAPSAASQQSENSEALGAAFLSNAETANLGLAKLNRSEWSMDELSKRGHVLPILKTTLGQIDGTIKPKFSHFSKSAASRNENLEAFGILFYQELFDTAPELKDTLFKNKPTELLALKLGTIMVELIRLLEIPSPKELAGVVAEMGLKHIEYGLEGWHEQPFKAAMIATMKKVITSRGHKWHTKTSRAWNWALTEIIVYLVEAVEIGRPKIQTLNKSWIFLCDKMYEETEARRQRKSISSQLGSRLGGSKLGSQMDGGRKSVEVSRPRPPAALPTRRSVNARGSVDGKAEGGWKKLGKSVKLAGALKGAGGEPKPSARNSGHVGEFPLWSKKDDEAFMQPEYMEGRTAVGQGFLDVFAARNTWAVRDFNFGADPSHAAKMGLALELIIKGATKPQALQHKLRVLSLGHVQMGIKPQMFKHFETALFYYLEQTLSNYHMYDAKVEEAWRWMWGIVSASFTRHMESASKNLSILADSWDYIETHHDLSDISDKFFALLFHRAPSLQNYFVKPKKMQTVMFVKAMQLIVKSVTDTKVLEVDLKAIALRHIKYDINSEHLTVFGEVLIATLGDVCGPHQWDEDIAGAWLDIYGHIAQVFGHVISSGRNLVSKALATGNSKELEAALELTPRNKRVLAALEIDVDDTVVSPLVWTISEGQVHLTDTLLRDILAIRGDRENYYYGRQLLWAKHPWIVRLLTEKAPNLLTTFLDGHLWSSRFMEGGCRRVNYYVRELYGDPYLEENANVYNTMLGVFIQRLPESELGNFAHPCVAFVINLKWELFARRDFALSQLLSLCNVLLNTIYMQVGATRPFASFSLALLQLAVAAMRLLSYSVRLVKQARQGNGSVRRLGPFAVLIPYSMTDVFMILNMVCSCFVVALFCLTWTANPFSWRGELDASFAAEHEGESWEEKHDARLLQAWAMVAAFTTGILWIQMAEVFKITTQLSALLFAISAVLADVLRFVLVLAVWVCGFSLMIYWLFVGANLAEGNKDIFEAMDAGLMIDGVQGDAGTFIYFIIMSSLGLTGINVIVESSWLVRGVYAVCVLSTVVVLLNLLVSTMVSTYETLQKRFHELAMKSRAQLVVRTEESIGLRRRMNYFDSLGFDERLDFDRGDDGPAGGIQRLVPQQLLTHDSYQLLDRVERFAGSSNPEAIWDSADRIAAAVTTSEMFGCGGSRNSGTFHLLGNITSDLERLSTELFTLKMGLRIGENDAASVAASSVQEDTSAVETSVEGGRDDAASKGVLEDADDNSDHDAAEAEVEMERVVPAVEQARPQQRLSSPAAPVRLHKDAPDPPTQAAEPPPREEGGLRAIGAEELAEHSSETSFWLPVKGFVHDCTTLMAFHPGGPELLLDAAGSDATSLFMTSHEGSSLAQAEKALKTMPVVGRWLPPEQPREQVPGLPIAGMAGPGGLPMYTPRDIDLEFETPR